MTKAELRDLALIAVNGGVLGQDSNILKADIEAYLPVAANDVLADWRVAKFMAQAKAKRLGMPDPYMGQDAWYSTMYRTPLLDSEENKWYVEIPRVASGGVEYVGSKKGMVTYNYVESKQEIVGFVSLPEGFVYRQDTTTSTRLYFAGQVPHDCDVIVRADTGIAGLEDGDEVNLPKDLEGKILDKVVLFFQKAKSMPADAKLDRDDTNEVMPNIRK